MVPENYVLKHTVAKRAQNTLFGETPTNRHNFANQEIILYSKHLKYDQIETRKVSGTGMSVSKGH